MTKRLLLIVPLLLLSACGSEETARQNAEAAERFDEAMTHLLNATQGYIATTDTPADNLGDYRLTQLNKAASLLSGLTRTGSEDQRIAAGLALSDVQAELGRAVLDDSLARRRNHAKLSNKALSSLAGAVTQAEAAATYRQQNSDAVLVALESDLQQSRQAKSATQQLIASTQNKLQAQQANQANLKAERTGFVTRAAELHSQRFSATGDERFELHKQYAATNRRADELAASVEMIETEIGVIQARLAEQQQRLAMIDNQIVGIQGAIQEIRSQAREVVEHAAVAADKAVQETQKLSAAVSEIDASFASEVRQPYAEANDHLVASVETLQSTASQTRDRRDRTMLQLALAGRTLELAVLQRQAAAAEVGHAELLATLTEQATGSLDATVVDTINQVSSSAKSQSDASRTVAIETLQSSLEPLNEVRESGRDDDRLAALNKLQTAYVALADLTGDIEMRNQLTAVRDEITELQAPEEEE